MLFICVMLLKHVKLERVVVFIKYVTGLVPLVFPPKK